MNSPLHSVLRTAVLGLGIFAVGEASAGGSVPQDCATSATCTWSVAVDNVSLIGGAYASKGDGTLYVPDQTTRVDLGDGSFASVGGLWGNIDPILGFNVSAGTGDVGKTFSFVFSMPIALTGPIAANSSVSYSLTSLSAAGAQVTPLFGHVVVAQEVDTSIGGLAPLNKGVDIGNTFAFIGGPQTQNSPVYTASSSFVGNYAYDLMSVVVSFSLSPNSQVAMSGFVQQVAAVPEPSGVALVLAAGVMLFAVKRRRNR